MSAEFVNNKVYRVAYKPARNAAYHTGLDVELVCPKCGASSWQYQNRTGKGKLNSDKMKFKCTECNQWFIANKNEVTKILGL